MKKLKPVIICLIALTLNILLPLSQLRAAATDTADSIADGICSYKAGSGSIQHFIDTALVNGAGETSEWYVMSLAQSGKYDFSGYERALLSYIDANNIASATSREKYALALIAIGSDDSYIISALESSVGEQGLMSLVFGLHILNNGYSGGSYTQKSLVSEILSLQKSDGGFAIMGNKGDVDCTAMTVQALAPYYKSDKKVRAACDDALELLSGLQQSNGCYSSFGKENCESTVQVLLALCSLGIDPAKDSRFIKDGNDLFSAVCSFKLSDGSFEHVRGGGVSESANTQVLYSMTGYSRLLKGKPAFYIFDNASPGSVEDTAPVETQKQTSKQTEKNTSRQTMKKTTRQTGGSTADVPEAKTTRKTTEAQSGSTSQRVTKSRSGSGNTGGTKARTSSGGNAVSSGKVTTTAGAGADIHTQTQQVHTSFVVSNGTSRVVTYTDRQTERTTSAVSQGGSGKKTSGSPESVPQSNENVSTGDSVLSDTKTSAPSEAGAKSSAEMAQGKSDTSTGTQSSAMEVSENGDSDTSSENVKVYIFIGIGVLTAAGVTVLIVKGKKNIKSYIFVIAVGTAVCAVTALVDIKTADDYYGGSSSVSESTAGTVTVSIDIKTISDGGDGYILAPCEVELHEGDTAYDVLRRITRQNGIIVDFKGSDDMIYVSGIDGHYEFDHGELSGWMYYVNEEAPSVNSSQLILHDGDRVEWKYTTEIGHDIDYKDQYFESADR